MMFETAFMLMLQDISCNTQSVMCIGQKLNSSKKTKESLVFQGPHLLNYAGNALKNHISFDNTQEETMAEKDPAIKQNRILGTVVLLAVDPVLNYLVQ
jgi:hypothetical protein